MAEPTVKIDLDAANPMGPPEVAPQKAVEKDVVFVPFKDIELTINRETLRFVARAPKKVTRDQARILLEADAGYLKE